MYYRITVALAEQPEGGYTVMCLELPELITEGDSMEQALKNVRDAFDATLELYKDLGRSLPKAIQVADEEVLAQKKERWLSTITPESESSSFFDKDLPPLWFQTIVPGSESRPYAS